MYRLITKEQRQNARQSWIKDQQTEKYLDIEILRKSETVPGHFSLVIWRGNAGHPYINYYYKSAESREESIINEKKAAERRSEYKAEQAKKGKTHTKSATAAALIKKILKKEYPHIKFSVRSDNFSMGNSVDVSWTDGIPTSAIDGFLRQFEQGTFDGMTDCYNYDNTADRPQAKYVHSNRHISESIRLQAEKDLCEIAGVEYIDSNMRLWDEWLSTQVWRRLSKMDLSKGYSKQKLIEYINS
uniref:Large polyvalent protein associated domain-containing protein n=1 Tax=viral metagenome TaxID=1070528 RepID=A0A6M3LPK1_9ZZZZ